MNQTASRKRRGMLVLLGLMACVLGGCMDSPAPPHSITASNPIYLAVLNNQQLQIDVISRPSFTVAGTLPVAEVGSYAPNGTLGLAPDGTIVFTYSAVFLNGEMTVTPSTVACTLSHGSCDSLLDGFGGGPVEMTSQGLAVPLWDDTSQFHGKVAFLSGSPLQVTHQVDLARLQPGFIQMSQDGNTLYCITQGPLSGQPPDETQLIRYDLRTAHITAIVSLGHQVPGALLLGPDHLLYVPILFNTPPTQTASGIPGTTVNVYNPDLSLSGVISVGQAPGAIALSANQGGRLVVAYETHQGNHLDIFDVTTRKNVGSVNLPEEDTISSLATLTDGDVYAVSPAVGSSKVGVLDVGTLQFTWHSFPGFVVGPVTG